MSTTTATTTTAAETVRLHITPLTPESYPIIVPASLHDSVSAVEYHFIPTFPEKGYGYIELPLAHADRFKKRLNGALVKGAKIKVETARAKPAAFVDDLESDIAEDQDIVRSGSVTTEKHHKIVDEGLIRGVRLPDSRKVRRGWTEPMMGKSTRKDKAGDAEAKRVTRTKKSEFTDKEELLFKTKTKVKSEPGTEKGKKRKRDDDVTIVHEFKQTTKFPSFLRGQAADKSKATTEYNSEKGWVDKDGNVVEGPRRSRRNQSDASSSAAIASEARKATAEVTKAAKKLTIQTAKGKAPAQPSTEESDEETSSSGSSGSEDDGEDEEDASPQSKTTLAKETSHSDLESAYEDRDNRESSTKLTVETTPKPERTIPSLEIVPGSAASETAGEIHPLEALFKKPKANGKKPPGLELKIPQSFSFFAADDNESEDGDVPTALPLLPQTPFTQADMRFRRERSAAPTPDTAAPTKLLFGPVMDKPLPTSTVDEEDDHSDDEASDDDEPAAAGSDTKQGRSEFAEKWFWENRGDNNRAWKKRRREVSKQKRYEGNKRRTRSSAA